MAEDGEVLGFVCILILALSPSMTTSIATIVVARIGVTLRNRLQVAIDVALGSNDRVRDHGSANSTPL
jgi:hypothetical protein